VKRAALLVVVLVLTGCGSSSSSDFAAPTVPQAKQLMTSYLDSKHLDYRWVACLRSGRSFESAAIVRCNVNFGDPHIEAYCIVLRDGKLYSDHDDPKVPCRRDNRAPPATITSS
jgi:hypothetical protein